jgi:hypothetical protein
MMHFENTILQGNDNVGRKVFEMSKIDMGYGK